MMLEKLLTKDKRVTFLDHIHYQYNHLDEDKNKLNVVDMILRQIISREFLWEKNHKPREGKNTSLKSKYKQVLF